MGVSSLPKTVTRDCDLNPGRSAPESSTLTTRLPSHLHELNSNVNSSIGIRVFRLLRILGIISPYWEISVDGLITPDIRENHQKDTFTGRYILTATRPM